MSRTHRFDWLPSRLQPKRRQRPSGGYGRKLRAEALEDRRVLAVEATIVSAPGDLLEHDEDLGFGDALLLDGVDDYVSIPSTSANDYDPGIDFTLETWVRVDPQQLDLASGQTSIIEKYNGLGDYPYAIRYLPATGQIEVTQSDGINPDFTITSTTSINDGAFHHIAIVRGNQGPNQKLELYIDGELEGELVIAGQGTTATTSPVFIGQQGGGANRFRGVVDEVRIWDVARSQSEIQATMRTPLAGDEAGLVAYYNFDDGTATDLALGNDGTLVNDVGFTEFVDPSFVGIVEIRLSAPVDVEPGIIVNYSIGGTATQGVDFYSSQLDLVTVDGDLPENSVYIPQGADSAVIALAALPDAIDELDETILISLLPDEDPFDTDPGDENYTISAESLAVTVTLVDSGLYAAGLALTNVFGEDATIEGLHLDANGQVTLSVKLSSQPEASVTVNVGDSTGGTLTSAPLLFTTENWDTAQTITLSGLTAGDDKVEDLLGSLSFSTSTTDPTYVGAFASLQVFDESKTTKVIVDEGGVEQPITPTVSVVSGGDMIEGDTQTAVLTFSSDVAAPAGGITVRYTLADDTGLGTTFHLLDDGEAAPGVRTVFIPAGQLSASVLVFRDDDQIASGDVVVAIDLDADAAYQIGAAASASVLLAEDDLVGIQTATVVDVDGVPVATPFDFTSFITTNEGGDAYEFGVRLTSQPAAPVTITIASSNPEEGAVAAVLVFDSGNWDQYQTATVTPQDDALLDGDRPYNVLVSAGSGDSSYDGLDADFRITNQDNESREDTDVDLADDSPIIATLGPVLTAGAEGGAQPQFEIFLSEPAPAGGLTVSYNVFERSATSDDLGLPSLVEQVGDGNPLALTQVDLPDSSFDAPYSLVFGDVDNDGDQDALLSVEGETPQYLENAGSNEVPDFVVNTDDNPLLATGGRGVAVGDVDNDGDLDFVQVNSAGTGLLYFENQLVDTGSLGFLERVGAANPFDAVALSGAYAPSLADLDNDGQLELFVTRELSTTLDYFVADGAGDYAAAAGNPLAGFIDDNFSSLSFADVDRDGDLDVYVGSFEIRYLENDGTPTSPLFVERTGTRNPADGVVNDGSAMAPGAVDINNDGDIDLFVANRRSIGEVESIFEVRYFDSVEVQEVVVPEGLTSLVVTLPVVDDLIDEGKERFEVALVSQQTETYDLVVSSDLDDTYDLEVVEVSAGSIGVNFVSASAANIDFVELLAGTTLDFGDAQATVTSTVLLDNNSLSILVPVTFDVGTVEVGDVATPTFDDTATLEVPTDGGLFGGLLDLRVGANETTPILLLEAGTQLTFSGGTTVEVTQTTVVSAFDVVRVPVTVVGAGTVGFDETVDVPAKVGELDLLVDEPGIDFYALAAGDKLTLSDGSVFVVTTPAVVATAAGDYNGDGLVDAADYVVWRDTLGSTNDLDADGDENGTVDINDYLLWRDNFNVESGLPVTGYVASGPPTTAGATTTVTEPGYRTLVDLVVTTAYDSTTSTVGLQIDAAEYGGFTIPAGTTLSFDGGAFATVATATSINNSSGTLVEVTPSGDPATTTILPGEQSGTADFFTEVTVIASLDGIDDGFVPLEIVNADLTMYDLTAGTQLAFTQSGVVVEVANTVTLDELADEVPFTFVEVFLVSGGSVGDILAGDTAVVGGVQSVGSVEFTIDDNDEAGVLLNISDTTTSETGDSETIGVTLTTEPTEDVIVVLALDGDEAVLSDNDETNQDFVQLLFTPLNWDVEQTVTVTGVDDDLDDGLAQYTLRTTALSADTEYADDLVQVNFPLDVSDSVFASLQVDDIAIVDTILPQSSQITFDNGAVLQADVDGDVQLFNDSAVTVKYAVVEPVDTIPAGETATAVDFPANNDDFKTDVLVVSALAGGLVSLTIDPGENDVSSATFLAGYEFTFSNGAVAQLDSDTTLLGSGAVALVPVTLIEGTEIPADATATFFETLDVTTAYDDATGDIGLQVTDPLISQVTFNADTQLEFSNGAYATIAAQTTITNTAESTVNVSVTTNRFSSQASGFFLEQLVDDFVFTNADDDGAGVTIRQTDPTLAVAEGASNNFFTVVLDSEPTDVVSLTLTPSDDNLRLADEFMGEPITISFDPSNWDLPQTVEVFAVDDAVLEYDHMSSIDVAIDTTDAVYDGLAAPRDVEVFIIDDELPAASVHVVAGAIEANAPGYFLVELDQPAPQGPDGTGIVVSYEIGGTADPTGGVNQTPDLQPLSGTVRIAPGETRSQLIAFPIDDFVAEGVNLVVGAAYAGGSDLSVAIDAVPFDVAIGGYNSVAGVVALQLPVGAPELETAILAQGTILVLDGATALVTQTVIIRDDIAVDVPITLETGDGSAISEGDTVYQRVLIPDGTELEFEGGASLTVDTMGSDVYATNEPDGTLVPVVADPLVSVALGAETAIPGESVSISLTTDNSEYSLGDGASAALIILDNDKPGVRIAELGDTTVVVEGEESSEFRVSLLSQPLDEVDITLTAPTNTVSLIVDESYSAAAETIGLSIAGTDVVSLSLPAGVYTLGGVSVEVLDDVTLLNETEAAVMVAVAPLVAGLNANDTGDYTYDEVLFSNGTNTTTLTFTPFNWFELQEVSFSAVDDLVVEAGDSHAIELSYQVTSLDPGYNNFEIAPQPVTIIDRRFDIEDTYQSLAEGFLTLEQSLESVSLPIVGDFSDIAPSIIDTFLEDLVEEIRATDNLTAETLGDAFEVAISAQFAGLPLEFLVTEISTEEIAFSLAFSDQFVYQVGLNTDFGLEALGISIESEGTLDFTVDYGFAIGFGISRTDGFFLSTEETSLEVAASLALSDDFAATGSLGFLQLDVANAVNFADATVETDFEFDAELEDNVIRLDVSGTFDPIELAEGDTIVIDSGGEEVVITVGGDIEIDAPGVFEIPVSDATAPVFVGDATVVGDPDGTMIDAAFVVTLEDTNDTSGDDTRLTLAEISAARASDDPYSFISYGFSGDAALDLDVSTTVSGNTAFPSFSFNLASSLPLFNYADEDEAGADETPTLEVTSGFSGVAEGAVATLTVFATASSDVRLAKGTQLTFGGVKVIVEKTATLSSSGAPGALQVKVLDDDSSLTSTQTINAGATATLASSGFNIAFNDITLDLGGFVTDLLGPILSGINDVVEPFQPVIDVLTSEVELLSSIGLAGLFDTDDDGAATLLEIALTLGGGISNQNTAEKFTKFADAVVGIIDLTGSLADLEQSIEDGGTLALEFGSYTLENFKGGSAMADASTVDVESAGTADAADTSPEDQTAATGNSDVDGFFGALDNLGITLDVVENPLNVIQLLLGQDIDLVTWDVPELDLSFTIEQDFPVFLGIRGLLQGEFNVYSDLVFGFDTFGFSQWAEDDFALSSSYLVFDGFYVSDIDPETGEDVPELSLDATIAIGLEANAVFASIAAIGGLTGSATLDLIDVGEYSDESDGRVRGSEIFSRLSRPATLFELTGSLEAFLQITVSVGIDLGFWSIEKVVYERELARATLFEFTVGGGGGGGGGALTAASFTTDTITAEAAAIASAAPAPTATAPAASAPVTTAAAVTATDAPVSVEPAAAASVAEPVESASEQISLLIGGVTQLNFSRAVLNPAFGGPAGVERDNLFAELDDDSSNGDGPSWRELVVARDRSAAELALATGRRQRRVIAAELIAVDDLAPQDFEVALEEFDAAGPRRWNHWGD